MQNVWMQLGDRYEADLGVSVQVTRAFSLNRVTIGGGRNKTATRALISSMDYSALSFETNEFTETVQAGISLSSIEAFKRQQFPVPCDFAVNAYVPTTGRNAVDLALRDS